MPPERVAVAADSAARRPLVRCAGIGDEAGATLDDQLRAIELLGWSAIELRSVDGRSIAELDERAFAQLVARLARDGVSVPCIASQIAGWARLITGELADDVAELQTLAGRCDALGCRHVRVMSYANDGLDDDAWGARARARLRDLAQRAEHAGLVLLHENCTGWAGSRADRMLELVDAVDSPAFGLLFDTGNGVDHGYEAYDVLVEIVALVRHVHVKDAVGSAGSATYTLPGAGQVRLADSVALLLDAGFSGTWSLEPHVALRPHESAVAEAGALGGVDGAAPPSQMEAFVACGRAFELLVGEHVMPGARAPASAPASTERAAGP